MLRGAGWAVGIFTWCAAWQGRNFVSCRCQKNDTCALSLPPKSISLGGGVRGTISFFIYAMNLQNPGCPTFFFCPFREDGGQIDRFPYRILDPMNRRKWMQLLCLVTCFLMMMSIALLRCGKLFGHDFTAQKSTSTEAPKDTVPTIRTSSDGTTVINTTALGADLVGYAGPVPIELHLRDGRIERLEVLPNSETPSFLEAVTDELPARWVGRTPEEAATMEVDVVSGATFTSRALIGNVRRAAAYATDHPAAPSLWDTLDLSPGSIAALLVVLLAAILPLFVHNRTYQTVQQVLNVAVLGFWSGSFLSYTLFLGYLTNGAQLLLSIVPIVMLVTAFIYPLFGRPHQSTQVAPQQPYRPPIGAFSQRALGGADDLPLDRRTGRLDRLGTLPRLPCPHRARGPNHSHRRSDPPFGLHPPSLLSICLSDRHPFQDVRRNEAKARLPIRGKDLSPTVIEEPKTDGERPGRGVSNTFLGCFR